MTEPEYNSFLANSLCMYRLSLWLALRDQLPYGIAEPSQPNLHGTYIYNCWNYQTIPILHQNIVIANVTEMRNGILFLNS